MAYFGRGKNKIQNPYNIREIYFEYKESVEPHSPYDVEYREFMTILDDYFKEISKGLLAGKTAYKMPFSLGYIEITKRKLDLSKLKRVDWKTTVETGKTIYHLNEHSDGFDYKIEWDRIRNAVRNAKLYVFSPTRKMKRTLAKLIKNKEFDTYEF